MCLLFGKVLCFLGLLGCCVVGFLGSWILELLACFVSGLLGGLVVCWLLGCWGVGLLGCWVGGLVGWWIVELDCWIVGLLVCCSVGLLVCCYPGLLDSQPGPAECAKRSAAPPGCGVLDEPQVCQDLVVLEIPRFLFLSLSFAWIFLFLTPPKPSPAPSAFRRAVHLFALPAVFFYFFLCFFPMPKNIKKIKPSIFTFCLQFFRFPTFFI